MSFLTTISDHAAATPEKVALEFVDPPLLRLTYRELDGLVNETAAYLKDLGLRPGDRMALQLSKCLEFILLHLAALRLGAISLPLNLAYPPDEVEYFLRDSGAALFVALDSASERYGPILSSLPDLRRAVFLAPAEPDRFLSLISAYPAAAATLHTAQPDDTAVIIYTSGTTGRPKGAEITHGNLTANLNSLHEAWGWRADDVLLHVLPIFHVHGLFVALHGALHAGATTLLMREFDPKRTLEIMLERGCTVLMAVPTIHRRLLDAAHPGEYDLSGVRLITSGSDRLPDDLFFGFENTFGYRLLERYGMTETGMNLSNPLHGERRPGSVGLPLPGVRARIAGPEPGRILPDGEVGEVQLQGANIFKGYWRQPEKTRESFTPDGWFRTGDLGFRSPDGYFTLCGRSKDLIISGGLNIYPPEVERVLTEHPAVEACAVIGCPDAEWGERVIAVVVLRPGGEAAPADLVAFCRERIAPYKSPRVIEFVQSLPRNAMGKVQKAELRKNLCKS